MGVPAPCQAGGRSPAGVSLPPARVLPYTLSVTAASPATVRAARLLAFAAVALFAAGCSINQLAVRAVGGMLAGGGDSTVFTGDDDPELVGAALPFALKLYETLLDADRTNAPLSLATGKSFVMFANAFVQTPADQLPAQDVDRQVAMRARAKKLALRGREYILRGLELRRPGFRAALDSRGPEAAIALAKREDADYMYWAGVAWLAAFSADPFDFSLIITLPRAVGLLLKVESWDEAYGKGSLQEILVTFYGSAPRDLGGSEEKARAHFLKAIAISKGARAGPYLALATAVSVKRQDVGEFRDLLGKALAVDASADPSARLENTLAQRKARWLLDHEDELFLEGE
jgi:predicted anti-sigma-YlaC factor YlaD